MQERHLCAGRDLTASANIERMKAPNSDIPPSENGTVTAGQDFLALAYDDLCKLAAHKMANEPAGQTLQATALVHEAWLRVEGRKQQPWQNRAHFFGAAAEAMRRILVESARRKMRLKRGGQLQRAEVELVDIAAPMPDEELLALDEALAQLSRTHERAAKVVKLCFFAGLTQEQAAAELGLSVATVERDWAFARAWLFREMRENKTAPN
jgi:RNA polymerase sigma factor (TIGR02999 family)